MKRKHFFQKLLCFTLCLVFIFSMVGCSGTTSEQPSSAQPATPAQSAAGAKATELTADVCVIGSGAAGTSAAVEAAEAGKKVIVLEKLATPGGNSAIGAQGLLATDSSLQAKAGYKTTTDDVFQEWMTFTHWKADAAIVREYLELSGSTVDWLMQRGVDLVMTPNVQRTHVLQTYHGYADFSKRVEYFKKLLAIVEKNGGQIMYETPAQSLIQDSTGAVTGVMAQKKDGTTYKINAKSVVIATGGFGGDADMVKKASGGYDRIGVGIATNTGDGIKMAWKAGAAADRENLLQYHVITVPGMPPPEPGKDGSNWPMALIYLPVLPHVNMEGSRFFNEDLIYDDSLNASAAASQGDHVFAVISQEMVDKLEASGSSALGMTDSVRLSRDQDVSPIKTPWTGLSKTMDDMIKAGAAFKADTYEDLAKAAGMNPSIFVRNMNKYEEMAKAGKDTEFLKSGQHMVPLGKGPYYAVKEAPMYLTSLGGLKINADFQVLKADRKPIPGLYCAGADTGVIYNDIYVLIEGGSLGWAFNSGRLAGKQAAANAKN
ncbi:MAG: FAD-dependent oxidoreductase [Clostridiales bacterium]|jgi:fumarate reductase flavoprotein subunit|nr:FAD-dependent oxidoreductase [Eubacteriales bacterium]MDH7566598.1 FAD-dependent oxidoreductase [Clostridiales bacterium]